MADPPQGNQHNPISDQASPQEMDLFVDVFDNNAPWIVGAEDGKDSFARASNGNLDGTTFGRFFYSASSPNRVVMLLGDWTMEFRMYLDALPDAADSGMVFTVRGFGTDTEINNNLMRIQIQDDGSLTTFWEYDEGQNVTLTFANTVVPVGQWFTLSCRGVLSGPNRTLYMYVDGVQGDTPQVGQAATGGANTIFGLFGRPLGIGAGTVDRVIRGRISSFHWADTDLGDATVVARSTLHKFTSVASTWCLHTFPEQPTQRDEAGRYPGMNPAPFTDLSGKTRPNRAQHIVCDSGFSKSFEDEDEFLMLPNTKELRDTLKGEFTLEFWFRHNIGNVSDKGFFEWFSAAGGDPEIDNALLRYRWTRVGNAWRPRLFYEHGAGVNEDDTGLQDLIDESENGAKSMRHPHHIALCARIVVGNREWDIYLDGAFVETIVAGPVATGGENNEHGRIGNASTNTLAGGLMDWVTMYDTARTPAQILENYNRGVLDCSAGGETTPPTVTVVTPPEGTPLNPDTQLVVDVQDETGLSVNRLFATFANSSSSEAIYDGTNFLQPYADFSSIQELTPGLHYRFTLRRTGGWPGAVALNVLPVDTSGNLVVP
jgi:hypothetical protein